VIAIIAILVSLLLSAVQKARAAASKVVCQNNLKQMGLALHLFHDVNQTFPSGYYTTGPFMHTGWQLQLLPYLDQENLWDQCVTFLNNNPGDTDSNSFPAAGFPAQIFVCPSNIRPGTTGKFIGVTFELTSYMGTCGTTSNDPVSADGVLCSSILVSIGDITDGTSNTIAVGERPVTGDLWFGWGFSPWGSGQGDAYLAAVMGDLPTNIGLRAPMEPTGTAEIDGAHYWSYHTGGANFLFCDGSVHYLLYNADSVFPALCTRAGGENVNIP
jgi:prepilin-type processing-associated H-X9-DG protein